MKKKEPVLKSFANLQDEEEYHLFLFDFSHELTVCDAAAWSPSRPASARQGVARCSCLDQPSSNFFLFQNVCD